MLPVDVVTKTQPTVLVVRRRLHIVRKGHLGDVLLTEPLARSLSEEWQEVWLVTEYPQAVQLLPTYTGSLPYSKYLEWRDDPANDVDYIVPAYELRPELPYIYGLADSVGIRLPSGEAPRIAAGQPPMVDGEYCLMAPDTSSWWMEMRCWPVERYQILAETLLNRLGIRSILLEPKHSFLEMVSLIEHCTVFVGPDSGPGILAQALARPAVIIFGATDWRKVQFSSLMVPAYVDVGCNGCRQWNRDSVVGCATPYCLTLLDPEAVYKCVEECIRRARSGKE